MFETSYEYLADTCLLIENVTFSILKVKPIFRQPTILSMRFGATSGRYVVGIASTVIGFYQSPKTKLPFNFSS
jgi:hypothetical protein